MNNTLQRDLRELLLNLSWRLNQGAIFWTPNSVVPVNLSALHSPEHQGNFITYFSHNNILVQLIELQDSLLLSLIMIYTQIYCHIKSSDLKFNGQ